MDVSFASGVVHAALTRPRGRGRYGGWGDLLRRTVRWVGKVGVVSWSEHAWL